MKFGLIDLIAWRDRLRAFGFICISVFSPLVCTAPAFAAEEGEALRIATVSSFPMSSAPSGGEANGFMIDAINSAARRSALAPEWRSYGSLDANTEALRKGEVDIIAGASTPRRQQEFFVTEPWWSETIVALTPEGSAIRSESGLRGKRLAMTPSAAAAALHFYRSSVVTRATSNGALEAVCLGEADAAIFAGMHLREVLLQLPAACRGFSFRAIDSQQQIDYALVSRRDKAGIARRLKAGLDEITADGTLTTIVARYPSLSTIRAMYLADGIRMRSERRIWAIDTVAAVILLALACGFLVNVSRSRRRLRIANSQLQVDLKARERAEAALRDSEARFRALFDSAPQTVLAIDRDNLIVFANRKSEEMFGHPGEELIGKSMEMLLPERLHAGFRENRLAGKPEGVGLRAGGGEFPIEISMGPVETSEGLTLAFISDISERVALQQQLLQAQKLESVGHLAGGVAHDFNNLLTVIQGYAEIGLAQVLPDDRMLEPLNEIATAAERAAALVRQLLMFSRRQTAHLRVLSLNELLRNLQKMLRRVIGEDIELTLSLNPGAATVRADPVHIEQVVMNLAINARDAMPKGGKLSIETASLHVDASEKSGRADEHADVASGEYIVLKVSDTGHGMTPEVRERAFEPFFTTKPPGKGTGLGLSTVYGIIKQSGGSISVDSSPGHGTTFTIMFPAAEETAPATRERASPLALSGKETILLAEDETGVRNFIRDVLRTEGYHVLEGVNGRSALESAAAENGPIHLLLADVVMPEMGGDELARRFSELRPGTPILLMSGYSDRSISPGLAEAVIEKPFTPHALLRTIREILNKR